MNIKKSLKSQICKVDISPEFLQKIYKTNFNCHYTHGLINANVRKKTEQRKRKNKAAVTT